MRTINTNELDERLNRLEERLDRLESLFLKAHPAAPDAAPPAATAIAEETVVPIKTAAAEPSPQTASIWRSEYWLHLTGIILLLFAVAFLFKYAIDQGWLTPVVRVGIGFLVGSGLLAAGFFLARQPRFSAMLLGGGVGAYYITSFAAFQLYQLLPHALVFGLMVLNTILAFVLSVRGNYLALSLLAVAGGLATPFLLSTGAGSTATLMAYTLLVLVGAGVIYAYSGWQPLLWLAAVGGLLVIAVGIGLNRQAGATPVDAWALQAGTVSWWLLFWLLPVGRPALLQKKPALREANAGWQAVDQIAQLRALLSYDLFLLTLITPLLTLGFTALIWTTTLGDSLGWVALGLAVVHGLAAYLLRRRGAGRLALFHLAVAALLSAIGLAILLEGSALLIALAGQAIALQLLARRLQRPAAYLIADLATGLPAIILLERLLIDQQGEWGRLDAAVDLLIIAGAAAGAWKLRSGLSRTVYALLAHAGLLIWFWRELVGMDDGQALVSAAWGVQAVILLVAGLRFGLNKTRATALATLALLVGKLFLIDLAYVNPLTRILLFFAFGGLFLFLSYLVTRFWQPQRPSTIDSA